MTALSTLFRPPEGSPTELCAALKAFDIDGVVVDRSITTDFLDELLRTPLPARIVAIETRGEGSREPMLASDDPDERAAAAKDVCTTLEQAAQVGCETLIVALGRLPGKRRWEQTRLRHARREHSAADAQELLDRRRAESPFALDLARYALDAIVDSAAHLHVAIGLTNRARWFEIPDDRELGALLTDFAGAPVLPWFDPAAAHAQQSLGLVESGTWLHRFGKQSAGAWIADACGLLGRLPWGLGEVATASVSSALDADCLRVVHCAPASHTDEIHNALSLAAQQRTA